MTKLAIVYHSGYGHTKTLAAAVLAGASAAGGSRGDWKSRSGRCRRMSTYGGSGGKL